MELWHGGWELSMLDDVLIVPTFSRPEFLWLCLEHLDACPGMRDMDLLVTVDNHEGNPPPLMEIEEVLGVFSFPKLRLKVQKPHSYPGNSYNLMTAYSDVFAVRYEYVFMVEDDVMVAPTFFQWHRDVHESESPACSIGVVQTPIMKGYASLGVCFQREELLGIVDHCCPEYFRDLKGYIRKRFRPSSFDFEQDGLICRVLEGKKVIWATTPQAQHVGWYGYHRKKSVKPSGTVRERYQKVKEILKDPVQLKSCVHEFGDIEPLKSACI